MPDPETCHQIDRMPVQTTNRENRAEPALPFRSPSRDRFGETGLKAVLRRFACRFALPPDQADHLARIKFPCC